MNCRLTVTVLAEVGPPGVRAVDDTADCLLLMTPGELMPAEARVLPLVVVVHARAGQGGVGHAKAGLATRQP